MEDYLMLFNVLLFINEFALIVTNTLFIFYSNTTKSFQIINGINILLFFIEIFILNLPIVFIFHIMNIPLICNIFCTIPDNTDNTVNNIYGQNNEYKSMEVEA
jgi:hypothetical protein